MPMRARSMTSRPEDVLIYHITDIANLPGIIASGLQSDAVMVQSGQHSVIGYDHIKLRRLQQIGVDCCGSRYVGEFVPFYFCPRSPMLFTVNMGNTGKPKGCQSDIVHLVSSVGIGMGLQRQWAFSDGNAGAFHTDFYNDITKLADLDWSAINAKYWGEKRHQKQSEFLVAEQFPWQGIQFIGCHNPRAAERVEQIMSHSQHRPEVRVKNDWYF
ncbi:DUF4433 domain-containing protein [Pseudomonas aeruginosa]|nr:DUF4433 domain-containing protein [Pseudomonas aeruginosa]